MIADHARCSTFLIADGVFPDKAGARVRAAPDLPARGAPRPAARHRGAVHAPRVRDGDRRDGRRSIPSCVERRVDRSPRSRSRKRSGSARRSTAASRCSTTSSRAAEGRREERPGQGRVHAVRHVRLPATTSPRSSRASAASAIDKVGFDEEMAKAQRAQRGSQAAIRRRSTTELKQLASEVGATKFTGYEGRGTAGEGTLKAIARRRRARRARAERREGRARVRPDAVLRRVAAARSATPAAVTTTTAKVRIDDTEKPAGDVHVLLGEVDARHDRRSATRVHVRGRRRAPRAHPREPLGDAPAAPRAQARARRSRRAEGLARRARPPALRLRALLADDRRRRCARSRTSSTPRSARTSTRSSRCCRSSEAKQRGAVAMFGEKYGDKRARRRRSAASRSSSAAARTSGAPATSACSRSSARPASRRACAASRRSPARARSTTCASSRTSSLRDGRAAQGRAVRGRAARRQAARGAEGARSRDREAQAAHRVGRRRARPAGRGRHDQGHQGARGRGRGRRREGPARHRRSAARQARLGRRSCSPAPAAPRSSSSRW